MKNKSKIASPRKEKICAILKQLRESAGILKQETLAFMAGISQSTINKIENNRRKINIEHIELLAPVLGLTSVELFKKLNEEERSVSEMESQSILLTNSSKDNNDTTISVNNIMQSLDQIQKQNREILMKIDNK